MAETKIDRTARGRPGKISAFIIGAAHPATVATQAVAVSGSNKDIKAARALFLKLSPGDRRAVMDMLSD